MGRYDDIHPDDIDPDTGRPYPNYSSPALDTTFHDIEMDVEEPRADQVRALLMQWKCTCSGGFYLHRGADLTVRARGFGEWRLCKRCKGTGLDPRATAALTLMPQEWWENYQDESYPPECTSRGGHVWVCDDTDEERTYCENCGADGNA